MSKQEQTEFLAKVYEASFTFGTSARAVVVLVASMAKSGSAFLAKIETEYKFGTAAAYMVNAGQQCDRDGAVKLYAKAPFKADSKDSPDKRTHLEQRAYWAGYNGWNYISKLADLPKRHGKGKRKAAGKTAQEKSTKESKPASAPLMKPQELVLAMPAALTAAEVNMFALNVATMLRTYEDKNAKAPFGALRPVFDAFITAVKQITAGVTGEAVTPAKPEPAPIPEPSKPNMKALKRLAAIDAANKGVDKAA
jgi:hypothetical protein